MSLEITLDSGIGEISVTIHGEEFVNAITFDDRFDEAIAYDKSMIEFGESETPLVAFLNDWNGGPFAATLNWFTTFKGTCLLCVDFVEHISHLIPKHIPEETIAIVDAMVSVRKYFSLWPDLFDMGKKKQAEREIESHRQKIKEVKYYFENIRDVSGLGSFEKQSPRINIIESVIEMLRVGLSEFSTQATIVSLVKDIRDMTSKAMAWEALIDSLGGNTEAWSRAMDEERAWQFRRLIDVTDTVVHGKPYPPLEATK